MAAPQAQVVATTWDFGDHAATTRPGGRDAVAASTAQVGDPQGVGGWRDGCNTRGRSPSSNLMILRPAHRRTLVLVLLLGAGGAASLGARGHDTAGPREAAHRTGVDADRAAPSASATRTHRWAGRTAASERRTAGLVQVSGTVRAGRGHAAVAKGEVEVVFAGDHGVASTMAAADGRYQLELPPGRYRVSAHGPGVLSVVRAERDYLPTAPSWDQVEVAAAYAPELVIGRDTDAVDVTVVEAGTVAGQVVDEAGRPVVGAVVRARSYDGLRPAQGTDVGLTDAAGRYQLEVAAGQHSLDAVSEATGAIADQGLSVVVAADAPASADLTLRATCTITGTVLAADGVPVTGGGIDRGTPGDDGFWLAGHIEADGSFRWSAPVDGPLALRAWPWMSAPTAGQTFACRPGARFDGVVFQVPDVAPDLDGAIAFADGTPAAGAHVEINALSAGAQSQQELADDAGSFAVFAMPPGEYEVSVVTARGAARQRVTVPGHGVRITVAGGALAGTVTGVADGSFTLRYDCAQSGYGGRELLVPVRGGRYQLDGLPACDLRLTAWTSQRDASAEVTVQPDQTAQADLDLTPPRMKTIVGTVLAPDGSPVAGAAITVEGDEAVPGRELTTDDSGHFRVEAESGTAVFVSTDLYSGDAVVGWADVPSETVEIHLYENHCEDCCEDCEIEGDYDEYDGGDDEGDEHDGEVGEVEDGEVEDGEAAAAAD